MQDALAATQGLRSPQGLPRGPPGLPPRLTSAPLPRSLSESPTSAAASSPGGSIGGPLAARAVSGGVTLVPFQQAQQQAGGLVQPPPPPPPPLVLQQQPSSLSRHPSRQQSQWEALLAAASSPAAASEGGPLLPLLPVAIGAGSSSSGEAQLFTGSGAPSAGGRGLLLESTAAGVGQQPPQPMRSFNALLSGSWAAAGCVADAWSSSSPELLAWLGDVRSADSLVPAWLDTAPLPAPSSLQVATEQQQRGRFKPYPLGRLLSIYAPRIEPLGATYPSALLQALRAMGRAGSGGSAAAGGAAGCTDVDTAAPGGDFDEGGADDLALVLVSGAPSGGVGLAGAPALPDASSGAFSGGGARVGSSSSASWCASSDAPPATVRPRGARAWGAAAGQEAAGVAAAAAGALMWNLSSETRVATYAASAPPAAAAAAAALRRPLGRSSGSLRALGVGRPGSLADLTGAGLLLQDELPPRPPGTLLHALAGHDDFGYIVLEPPLRALAAWAAAAGASGGGCYCFCCACDLLSPPPHPPLQCHRHRCSFPGTSCCAASTPEQSRRH